MSLKITYKTSIFRTILYSTASDMNVVDCPIKNIVFNLLFEGNEIYCFVDKNKFSHILMEIFKEKDNDFNNADNEQNIHNELLECFVKKWRFTYEPC